MPANVISVPPRRQSASVLAAWASLLGFFLLDPVQATRVEQAYYQKYGQPIPSRGHLTDQNITPLKKTEPSSLGKN